MNAIAATAALPTLRLHAEVGVNSANLGGQANMAISTVIDADIDLATRQFAGRSTTQIPRQQPGAGLPAQQVSDVIVMTTATFTRSGATGRWTKTPMGLGGGLNGGPTNAQIAQMLSNLLSNPAIGLELRDAASCSLGTCDHVIAHIDGRVLASALGPLLGVPIDAASGASIPSFDVDLLIDQATSVISEARTQVSAGGSATQVVLVLTNPGQPVQIVAPPAVLTDDLGANFGGGGGVAPAPTTIGEPETAQPADPEVLPSTP